MQLTTPTVYAMNLATAWIGGLAAVAGALILCVAFVAPAQATVIPPSAVYSGSVSTKYPLGYESWTQSGTYVGFLNSDGFAVQMSGQSNSVYSSDSIGTSLSGATSNADITYYYEVVGPATGSPIPMTISYLMAGTGLGYYGVLDQIEYSTLGGLVTQSLCSGPIYASGCAGNVAYGPYYSATAPFTINANQVYSIFLSTEPSVRNYAFAPGTQPASQVEGSIDPFLQIGSGFASDYQLVFSSGVLNGTPPSAVSEPPSLYLFLFGLLLLGAASVRELAPAASIKHVI